jgi:Zn-dependent M32 family carboxypeptidase
MIEIEEGIIEAKIDWNDLDRCWAEQYEEDYGNLFS